VDLRGSKPQAGHVAAILGKQTGSGTTAPPPLRVASGSRPQAVLGTVAQQGGGSGGGGAYSQSLNLSGGSASDPYDSDEGEEAVSMPSLSAAPAAASSVPSSRQQQQAPLRKSQLAIPPPLSPVAEVEGGDDLNVSSDSGDDSEEVDNFADLLDEFRDIGKTPDIAPRGSSRA
jgi:hypothetical protein